MINRKENCAMVFIVSFRPFCLCFQLHLAQDLEPFVSFFHWAGWPFFLRRSPEFFARRTAAMGLRPGVTRKVCKAQLYENLGTECAGL